MNGNGTSDLGFAKLDLGRKERTGFSEVVFCQGKSCDQLKEIYKKLFESEGEVLGTRATEEQFNTIRNIFPDAVYDKTSRILKIEKEGKALTGNIAVCCAGTADLPVAEEAAGTADEKKE